MTCSVICAVMGVVLGNGFIEICKVSTSAQLGKPTSKAASRAWQSTLALQTQHTARLSMLHGKAHAASTRGGIRRGVKKPTSHAAWAMWHSVNRALRAARCRQSSSVWYTKNSQLQTTPISKLTSQELLAPILPVNNGNFTCHRGSREGRDLRAAPRTQGLCGRLKEKFWNARGCAQHQWFFSWSMFYQLPDCSGFLWFLPVPCQSNSQWLLLSLALGAQCL